MQTIHQNPLFQTINEEEEYLIIKDGAKKYHVLHPVFVAGQKYQQIIKESEGEEGKKYVIYTKQKDGIILTKDKIIGD